MGNYEKMCPFTSQARAKKNRQKVVEPTGKWGGSYHMSQFMIIDGHGFDDFDEMRDREIGGYHLGYHSLQPPRLDEFGNIQCRMKVFLKTYLVT